jgi:hypothetical protein
LYQLFENAGFSKYDTNQNNKNKYSIYRANIDNNIYHNKNHLEIIQKDYNGWFAHMTTNSFNKNKRKI